MSRHPDPEVLVVGAGPVGLVAALFLRELGMRVEIIDMHRRTTQHSYALAIHPRTLRVLDGVGLTEKLIGAGRKIKKVAYYQGSTKHAQIDYSALPTHPYLLVIRQSVLERMVEAALHERNSEVLWEHRLQALHPEPSRVKADVARLAQVATGYPVARTESLVAWMEAIHASYVIGADGYDSAVRRMAGIETDTLANSQVFSVYEVEATGDLPADVRIILDPELTSVYWPLEDGRCRWGFQIQDAARHDVSMETLTRLMAERAPWCTARPTQIYWSTLAVFEQRVARCFGAGGIWLAGDAAHQAAPVGVHSMNAGLVEARELASRIAWHLREGGTMALETFARDSQAAWGRLVGAGQHVQALPDASPWVREARARIVATLPASGEDVTPLLAQIGLTVAGAVA